MRLDHETGKIVHDKSSLLHVSSSDWTVTHWHPKLLPITGQQRRIWFLLTNPEIPHSIVCTAQASMLRSHTLDYLLIRKNIHVRCITYACARVRYSSCAWLEEEADDIHTLLKNAVRSPIVLSFQRIKFHLWRHFADATLPSFYIRIKNHTRAVHIYTVLLFLIRIFSNFLVRSWIFS